mgnify:CR=1 FL=1
MAIHLEKHADLPKLQALYKYLVEFSNIENIAAVTSRKPLQELLLNDTLELRKRIVEDYRAIVAAKYLKFVHDSPFDEIAAQKEAAAAAKRERELAAQQQSNNNAGNSNALDAQRQVKKPKLPTSFAQSQSNYNGASATVSADSTVRQLKQQLASVQGERKILRDFVIAMREYSSAMGHAQIYAQCFAELEDKIPNIFSEEQEQQTP